VVRDIARQTAGRPATSRTAARTPAERGALGLQQVAGNRAMGRLLARQVTEEETEDVSIGDIELLLLDDAQVTKAIRFYTSQPARYTPDIVREIQAAVGVEQTGTADEDTVQAVARWQSEQGSSDPALKVDGMAGPRTLPRMFARGLNAAGEGQAFGEEAQAGVIDRWNDLTPRERADELVRLVNTHLEAAGVPAVTIDPRDTGNDSGSFHFARWQMRISLPAVSSAQLTLRDARELVDTIYHEARHAEQWFRIAQVRAGQGRAAGAIATELGIQRRIADRAKADPLDPQSMQGVIALGWYDSVYGSGSAHREATLSTVEAAATARNRARDRNKAHPSAANQAALDAAEARFQPAHDAYRDLPEENDAWATGPMARAGVTSGSPPPPPPEALLRALEALLGARRGAPPL
jgi:hypothetical protein